METITGTTISFRVTKKAKNELDQLAKDLRENSIKNPADGIPKCNTSKLIKRAILDVTGINCDEE